MSTLIKTLPTTSVEIKRQFDNGQEISLAVHFNVYGEVLKIENDYFDFSKTVKLMVYGNSFSLKVKKLIVFVRELKHMIPMMAAGLVKEYQLPDWLKVVQSALDEIQVNHLQNNEDIKNEWTKQFYDSSQKEKYRYFFKLFLTDENAKPSVREVITQLDDFCSDDLFLDQLEADDIFAKTYLLCLFLQASSSFYTEQLEMEMHLDCLGNKIDYSKVGLKIEDQAFMDWMQKNKDFPIFSQLDKYEIDDLVLDQLLNTFVLKVINVNPMEGEMNRI